MRYRGFAGSAMLILLYEIHANSRKIRVRLSRFYETMRQWRRTMSWVFSLTREVFWKPLGEQNTGLLQN
jgi:hypothetical protein